MFTIQYRETVRKKIIEMAKQDNRIASAAVVGSFALGKEDDWSDIDLTFGVKDGYSISEILESWSQSIISEFMAVILLDVKRAETLYRVFILPGCLQLDISFSYEKDFGALGNSFKLLFGEAYYKIKPIKPTKEELFGWIIHHLVRARFCVERNKLWQAEFLLSEARYYSLKIACLEHNCNSEYARGFDDLPSELLIFYKQSLIKEICKTEIIRVIKLIILGLFKISKNVEEMTYQVSETLSDLSTL